LWWMLEFPFPAVHCRFCARHDAVCMTSTMMLDVRIGWFVVPFVSMLPSINRFIMRQTYSNAGKLDQMLNFCMPHRDKCQKNASIWLCGAYPCSTFWLSPFPRKLLSFVMSHPTAGHQKSDQIVRISDDRIVNGHDYSQWMACPIERNGRLDWVDQLSTIEFTPLKK
jgi:hypothetical protein